MENRYDKYKDSGIAWIGEIPEHWEVKKGKNLFKKEERPIKDNDEIITCFRDGEVTLRSNRRTDGFTNAMKEIGYQGVRKGDLVIHNMDAFAGAIGVSDSDGKSTPVYSVCTPKNNKEADVYYYAYLLRSYALGGVIQSLAKGIRERSTDFRYKEFGDLFYQQPPIDEQQSIATYLDQKCSEIDELIALQEEMITKLQSYKQSVITEAVTKGLDKNVPLKNSGIEWIGEIPEHWKVKRLKNSGYIYGGLTGKAGNDFNVEESDNYGYFIPFTNIFNNMYIDMNLLGKVKISLNEKQNNVIKNDILFLMSSEDYDGIGKSSLCKENHPQPLYLNSFCKGLRVGNKFNSIFLNYFMNSAVGKYFCQIASNGFIRINLRQDKLLSCPILCPSLSEQQSIADYLDQKCSEIDELISIKQQKIEKLKDYKKSLIFECVTGKRKV